jgi:protein SCO1/2
MKWLATIVALVFLAGTPAEAQIQPSQFASFAFRQHPGAQLPLDALLHDESGRTVRLGDYFGHKPAVVVLEYLRCPNLCGLVLGGLVAQMREQKLQPGRDLQFVAISIDPKEQPSDGRAAREKYLAMFGTASPAGWHFLTGDPAQVRQVASAIGFPYRYDKALDQFAHPAGFVVATPDGRIAQYQKPGQLKAAVDSAARGVTRPPAFPLLCLCLGYDPQPGTVQAIVMSIVRAVSAAVVTGCILLIAFLARRRHA